MLIGYARVSTQQQDTALQLAALRGASVSRLFEERCSGVAGRPLLEAALYTLRRGDTLVVYKLDRLARSLIDLMRILERIEKAGAGIKSLTEPIDTTTPAGRCVVQMLGAVAELERNMIRERCEAGRRAARDRGVRFGRPPLLREHEVRALADAGLYLAQAARRAGVSQKALRYAASKWSIPFVPGPKGRRGRPE